MDQLPANVIRANIGKMLAVPSLTFEPWDMGFEGQDLCTCYFDTPDLALRRARAAGGKYLTLRIRHYQPVNGGPELYALGAKTESDKFRVEIDPAVAQTILADPLPGFILPRLPPDFQARFMELVGDDPLQTVVAVHARPFTVGGDDDRLTLDAEVHTDKGQRLPYAVLEFKSNDPGAAPPARIASLCLRPIKLSKFLWATGC